MSGVIGDRRNHTETMSSSLIAGEDVPPFHVVGIGASAGGLEALERLFAKMPEDTGLAFVVVQHLSPDFKSHMDELLGRQTRIPIRHVEDGMEVEPDHIYLIPAGKKMIVSQGRLLLTDKEPESGLTMPIDDFLRSLAQDARRQAIAIILSGTGSDGSRGVKYVHDAGGLVIAQSEDSAAFDGMPLAAQETGLVDLILPPEAMPSAMLKHVGVVLEITEQRSAATSGVDEHMERIFARLQSAYGIDFTNYKPSTVLRRTERRLGMNHTSEVADYADLVERDPGELNNLYCDLLIGVTRFFRDPTAYERLESEVIPQILTRLDARQQVRVWVAGCATGEEAYSIAMLFHEHIERSGRRNPLKVFATDVHKGSLEFASAGVYPPEALTDVREDRRRRYFEEDADGFHVIPELRQSIVFAPHNVLKDAPFTKLELITCRNLLIYFQPMSQKKVLSLFHFGLRANGFLFLGPSESPGDLQDEFDRISDRSKIYRKRRDMRLPTDLRTLLPAGPSMIHRRLDERHRRDAVSETNSRVSYESLLSRFMPPALLVSETNELLHTFGGAEKYLRVPAGRSPDNVFAMVQGDLRTALVGAIHRCRKDRVAVKYSGVMVRIEGADVSLRIEVEPLLSEAEAEQIVVTFDETDVGDSTSAADDAPQYDMGDLTREHLSNLENELRHTKENLQATIEELETSNEELQAANEELVASNEELQSTNEELHSVNEELYTVNAEHQRKIGELTELTDDVNNLLENTEIGVLFLDADLRIRKFTPVIADKFDLLPGDVGRRIDTFAAPLADVSLYEEVTTVLSSGRTVQKEVCDHDGHPYFLRVLLYRGQSNGGVLLTLVDVAELTEARAELQAARERYRDLYEHAPDLYLTIDAETTRVLECNDAVGRTLGRTKEDIVGRSVFDVYHQSSRRAAREAFETFLETGSVLANDLLLEAADGRIVNVSLNASAVRGEDGRIVRSRSILRDMTESRHKDTLIEQGVARNAAVLESTLDAVITMDARGCIVEFNPAAETIFGYASEEAIGAELCELLLPERFRDRFRAGLAEFFRSGSAPVMEGRQELPAMRSDGSEFPCELTVTRIEVEGLDMFTGFVRDLTEKHAAEQEIRVRENRFRGMFDNAAVGMARIDLEGRWLEVNDRLCQILGRPREDLLAGNSPCDVLADGELMRRLLDDAEDQVVEQRPCDCPNGETVWLSWTVSLQHDANGAADYAVAVVQDITRQRGFEEELRDAIRARESFLAMLSHELRNPLSALVNAARLLKRDESPEADQVAEVIDRQSSQMARLLRDLLDVSRIATGKITLDWQPVDLVSLFDGVRETITPAFEENDVTLVVELPEEPVWVDGDATRLQQVQVNLLANAAKYSDRAGRVLFSVEPEDGDVVIRVVDNGIGIAGETLGHIFEPFVQSDQSRHRSEGGLGVGLTLVARLVELHGGTVTAHSDGPGCGSEFIVRLPLRTEAIEAGTTSAPPTAIARSRRIALVEDIVDNASLMQANLQFDGHEVSVDHDGRSGLERILRERPEVVLLDIGLPDIDGYEVARRIRRQTSDDDWTPTLVALTGYGREADVRQAVEAGFDHHLVKPVDFDALTRIIAAVGTNSVEAEDSRDT